MSGRDTWSTGHLILTRIQENAANALLITNGVLFVQEGLWSLIRLTSFPNTCFSTRLVMSFAGQLVSDFVSTPYVSRQRPRIKVTPPLVTCMILMIFKISRMSFFTALIPT